MNLFEQIENVANTGNSITGIECPNCHNKTLSIIAGAKTNEIYQVSWECDFGCTTNQIYQAGNVTEKITGDIVVENAKRQEFEELLLHVNCHSLAELNKMELTAPKFVVDGLIPNGLVILGAPSKIGKSWFCLQLANAVARGDSNFLGFNVNKGKVLYLALEDSEYRIKERSTKQGNIPSNDVYFWTKSSTLKKDGAGLINELEIFLANIDGISLIIIDVFQKIRDEQGLKESSYSYDYRNLGQLKELADKHAISILLVHHTRKMKDLDDPFNNLSGTTGIMGSADTSLILDQDATIKSPNKIVTMYARGRDHEEVELCIEFDKDKCIWKRYGTLDEVKAIQAEQEFLEHPLRNAIINMMKDKSELCFKANEIIIKASDLKKPFNNSAMQAGKWLNDTSTQANLYNYDQLQLQAINKGTASKVYKITKLNTNPFESEKEQ